MGVAFKLAHAITNKLIDDKKINKTDIDLKKYLDLVALGTISDMGRSNRRKTVFSQIRNRATD